MDATERRQQIEALVIMLLEGYPSLINAGEGTVASYVRPLLSLSPQAVRNAVDRYQRGDVPGHDARFAPNATEFYLEAQKQEGALQSRDVLPADLPPLPDGFKRLPGGVVSYPIGTVPPPGWDRIVPGSRVNYGHGDIELGGLTHREAEVIGELGGLTPEGKNFAYLTFREIRDEIARYLPASVAA